MAHAPHFGHRRMEYGARRVLMVASAHFLIIGYTLLFYPVMYQTSSAFVPIVNYTGVFVWGIAHAIAGVVCLTAVITRWPSLARLGMFLAGVVNLVTAFAVGWGVLSSWFAWMDGTGNPASPLIPVGFAALGAKDLIMLRDPLRTHHQELTEAKSRLEET